MTVDISNLISITEANQNFSKVARMVDEKGTAVILKNNVPRYVLLDISTLQSDEYAEDSTIQKIGESLVKKHLQAFKEPAK